MAINEAASEGDWAKIEALLKAGTDINSKDESGRTALHCAIEKGHDDVYKRIIGCGGKVNAKEMNGFTPLHLATKGGHVSAVSALLGRGAKINAKTSEGVTAIHIAAIQGHMKLVAELLEEGANINAADPNGMTPLHIVVERNYDAVCGYIFDYSLRVDVNAKEKNGLTPLHLAAQGGNQTIMARLLHEGADVNAKTNAGSTALQLAVRKQNWDCARALSEKGADMKKPLRKEETTEQHGANTSSDEDIAALASRISADQYYTVGGALGFTNEQLHQVEYMCYQAQVDSPFLVVLRRWRDGKEQESATIERLKEILGSFLELDQGSPAQGEDATAHP